MTKSTDWISAICSLVAAIVGVVTLITVYVAAMQILSRRQLYRLGISVKSLGPWKPKVVSPSLLRMQTQISTPTISLPRLVESNWQPKITFPIGFDCMSAKAVSDPEKLAEASWVNFLQALGLGPESDFYEMQSEPELVNGIVPMRWKGRDLVGICSMLGFQSHEDKPSYKTPMPLPMQWSGPLGWLQFRASSDGCIAEYRRRRVFKDQLSDDMHKYYRSLTVKPRPLCLESRLWQSINGLYLPNREILYIGGTDRNAKTRGDNIQCSMDDICDEVMSLDPSEEEIRKMLWGKKSNVPRPVDTEKGLSQLSQSQSLPEFLRGIPGGDIFGAVASKKANTLEVLTPCPGLLSVIVEGELASSRGLDLSRCREFHRTYTDLDDVDKKSYPYRLGRLCMNEDLLKLFKEAVLSLVPDGFYFTPTRNLGSDINEVWDHVDNQSDKLKLIFPVPELTGWQDKSEWTNNSNTRDSQLYHGMVLCNEFQHTRATSRAVFTIEDMKIISKASISIREIVLSHKSGRDLIWALLVSPSLFSALVQQFGQMKVQDVLKANVESKDGILDCTSLIDVDSDLDRKYPVPLMNDGDFSGAHILAAFLDVFLTYFWIDKSWISDVAVYDATVPQSVTMC